jgi:membrane protein implicated in regulation of membrane protease activity
MRWNVFDLGVFLAQAIWKGTCAGAGYQPVMRHERMLTRKQTFLTICACMLGLVGGYLLWEALDRMDFVSSAILKGVLPVVGFLLCGLAVNRIPSAMTLDADGIVGSKGVVVTEISEKGQIRLGAELWTAHSATGEIISEGTEVVVCAAEGLVLQVVRAA